MTRPFHHLKHARYSTAGTFHSITGYLLFSHHVKFSLLFPITMPFSRQTLTFHHRASFPFSNHRPLPQIVLVLNVLIPQLAKGHPSVTLFPPHQPFPSSHNDVFTPYSDHARSSSTLSHPAEIHVPSHTPFPSPVNAPVFPKRPYTLPKPSLSPSPRPHLSPLNKPRQTTPFPSPRHASFLTSTHPPFTAA